MGAMTRIINGVHPDVHLESGDCVIFHQKLFRVMKKLYFLQNSDSKKQNGNDQRRKCLCSCFWSPK